MAATDVALFSLNAGEISRHALARVDLAKLRIACEVSSNFLPHALGPTQLRPGKKYIAAVPGASPAWLGEFYYSETKTVLFVMTAAGLYFLVNDALVTRPGVTAAVVNGTFDSTLASWTDSDEAGAASSWSGGMMALLGTGTNYALRDQQVTVNEPGIEHALRIVVLGNPIVIQVGTSAGDGTYIDATLLPGTYSLAFTPSANFWIRLGNISTLTAYVDSITIEGPGTATLPVPYAAGDFGLLRYDQSEDVTFVACAGYQQRRIERRSSDSRSWGIALYRADDGPFRLANIGSTTITPSATTGSATLTASRPLFQAGHVGALWRMTHSGQQTSATLAAVSNTTGNIRVSGLAAHSGNASFRGFSVVISGTFVGTIALQRSLGAPGSWTDVKTYTAPVSETYDDTLDNQIIYYRLEMTAYTSGAATASLIYSASSQTGIVRITNVASNISATADVLQELGDTTATNDWAEGEWSDYRGWPGAVALHDGRLAWFGGTQAQMSISDAFASFDDTVEGDSGPINRTIATGGEDGARWALSLQRLLVGTAAQEISIRASALDEPLTPTQFTARVCATRGVAPIRPVKIDTIAVYVERNRKRVFELLYDVAVGDFKSRELTRLKQEMCDAGVVDVAVQRQPDTRLWFVLADGTCAILTYDQDDEVLAWTPATTSGSFERVAVLPGTDEDDVYFVVARNVGGTKRYIEKLAKRSECVGGSLNKNIDSHIAYSGAPTTALSAPHLAGQQVVVWADGAPLPGTITLNGSGNGTLAVAASNIVYGLGYTGRIKTAKLAYGGERGAAISQQKRVSRLGLVMADVSWQGVRIGRDFTNMTGLPATYRGKPLTAGQVLTAYDAVPGAFNGGWDADARACIQVSSPHCCTIEALAMHLTTNEPDPPAPRNG